MLIQQKLLLLLLILLAIATSEKNGNDRSHVVAFPTSKLDWHATMSVVYYTHFMELCMHLDIINVNKV